jgi:hypothetical protein
MQTRKLYLFFLLFLGSFTINMPCRAQLLIKQIGKNAGSVFSISDLQSIILDNKADLIRRVAVTATCKDDSGIVFQYLFPPIILEPGLQVYSFDAPDTSAIKFRNTYQKNYFALNKIPPPGKYKLSYNAESKFIKLSVIPLTLDKVAEAAPPKKSRDTTQKDKYPIDPSQFNFKRKTNLPTVSLINPADEYEQKLQGYFRKVRGEFKLPNLAFHGRTSLSYNYNPQPASNMVLPADFLSGEISPRVSYYGIPFGMSVLYTYDLRNNKPFFNQFNLSFDKAAFRQGLMSRVAGSLEATRPKGEFSQGNIGTTLSANAIYSYGNNPYSLSTFNTIDKAAIQDYRYEKERLLKYKDSLEWADPTKAKNIDRLTQQLEFQNTMNMLSQQNLADRKHFEDSLSKKDVCAYQKLKDAECENTLKGMQGNKWPNKPEELENIVPISKAEKNFYHVNNLSIGKSYFNYTPFSIMGVGVTGGDIAVNFSKLYVQASAGLLDMKQSLWFQSQFSQKYMVEASRVGWGQADRSHLHVLFVNFASQPHTGGDSLRSGTSPQSNTLIGIESTLNPFKNLLLKTEYMKSFSRFSIPALELTGASVPNQAFSKDAIHINSQYSFRKIGTDLIADINRIGGNYYTVGNPYLRNNIFNYAFRFNQGLINHAVQVHAGVRQESDNMDGRNTVTTQSQRIESGFSLYFKKFPTLNVNFLPVYFNQRQIGEVSYRYFGKAVNLNASSSCLTSIAGHSLSSTAVFSHSVNENILIRPSLDLYTSMICENYSITKRISLRAIFTYNKPSNHNDSLKSFITDVSVTFPLKKYGSQAIGFKINDNPLANQYYIYTQSSLRISDKLSGNLYIFHNLSNKSVSLPYQPVGNLVQLSVMGWW